jgi:transcriptional regulator with XRE-family HTH domain
VTYIKNRIAKNLAEDADYRAAKLKISQERVSQIERGVETLSVDRLLDMTAALGLRMVIVEEEEIRRHGLEKMVVS